MSANGQPVFQNHFGLRQRQGIAFNRIRVVGRLDAKILMQPPNNPRVKGTIGIELLLFLRNPPFEPGIHLGRAIHDLICSFHLAEHLIPGHSTIFSRRKEGFFSLACRQKMP